LAKKLAFFSQTTASFCKNLIITLVFEKHRPLVALHAYCLLVRCYRVQREIESVGLTGKEAFSRPSFSSLFYKKSFQRPFETKSFEKKLSSKNQGAV
jgi:hypothetical protein